MKGYAVLAVVVGLVFLGAGVLVLSEQSSSISAESTIFSERVSAEHLLDSAEVHARWELGNRGCLGYQDQEQTLGLHQYGATFNAPGGSPVQVDLNASMASGRQYSRSVTQVISNSPVVVDVIEITKTAYMDEKKENDNFDDHADMHIGKTSDFQRAIFEFSLDSIAPTSNIIKATLKFTLKEAGEVGDWVQIHRVTGNWSESIVSWNWQAILNAWSNPGSDYAAPVEATFQVGAVGDYEVDITDTVKAWHDGTHDNDGLMMWIPAPSGNALTKIYTEDHQAGIFTVEIEHACECGQTCAVDAFVACDASIRPNVVDDSFVPSAADDIGGIAALPDNTRIMGLTLPETGGYVTSEGTELVAWSKDGTELGSCSTGLTENIVGLGYVLRGPKAEHLAFVSAGVNTSLHFVGGECSVDSVNITAGTISDAGGLTYLTLPDGETYEDHFVVTTTDGTLHFVEHTGAIVQTLATGLADVNGLAHVYNEEKLLLLSNATDEIHQLNFSGVELDRWDYYRFHAANAQALTIDTKSCGQVLSSRLGDQVTVIGRDALSVEPIAHWRFDATAGTSVRDNVGPHDGLLTTTETWMPTTGAVQGALDIVDQGATVANAAALTPANGLSIAGWMVAESGGKAVEPLVVKEVTSGTYAYWFGLEEEQLTLKINNGSEHVVKATNKVSTDQWHHVAASYNPETGVVKLYVDGAVTETGSAFGLPLSGNGDLHLGRFDAAHGNGLIDDVYLFDGTIRDSDVSLLYGEAQIEDVGAAPGMGGALTCEMGRYRDDFNTGFTWDGSYGTLTWPGDWTELSEGNGPLFGDLRKVSLSGGSWARISNGDHGLQRNIDLSIFADATLKFDYARFDLEGSDTLTYGVGNGAGFTALGTITGAGTDPTDTPLTIEVPITDRLTSDAYLKFENYGSMASNEGVYIDFVEVEGCLQ